MPRVDGYAIVEIYSGSRRCLTDRKTEKDLTYEYPYLAIIGTISGRRSTTQMFTPQIKEITETKAITSSGQVYELGAKNANYAKFEEAVAKGIPVLVNWSIGELTTGVYIKGNIRGKNETFMKRVIDQKGPILYCSGGNKIYVDWLVPNIFQDTYINGIGIKKGYIKGRKVFCGCAFEPEILESNWQFVSAAPKLTNEKAKLYGVD